MEWSGEHLAEAFERGEGAQHEGEGGGEAEGLVHGDGEQVLPDGPDGLLPLGGCLELRQEELQAAPDADHVCCGNDDVQVHQSCYHLQPQAVPIRPSATEPELQNWKSVMSQCTSRLRIRWHTQ